MGVGPILVDGLGVQFVELGLPFEQTSNHIVVSRCGQGVDIAPESHTVHRFLLGFVGLGLGDSFTQIRKLLGSDVLFFVDLPDLVFALVGDTCVFGFFNFNAQFFEFGREPVRRLHGRVVLAAKIFFDVIMQVCVDDLRGELRAFRFELHFDQAAVGNAPDTETPEKRAQNCGSRVVAA